MTLASIQSTTATVTLEETDMAKKKQSATADLTVTKTITVMKCPKCGHEWEPRTAEPRQCPGCNFRLFTLRPQEQETK